MYAAVQALSYFFPEASFLQVTVEGGHIVVKDGSRVERISYSQSKSPGDVEWDKAGCTIVMECSGAFLTRAKLAPFFDKGVKKVIVSAPVKDPEPVLNVVMGCNDHLYDPAK